MVGSPVCGCWRAVGSLACGGQPGMWWAAWLVVGSPVCVGQPGLCLVARVQLAAQHVVIAARHVVRSPACGCQSGMWLAAWHVVGSPACGW